MAELISASCDSMVGMIAPFLALAMMSQSAIQRNTGLTLYHSCQAIIREADSATGSEADRREGMHCVDYVSGFMDASVAAGSACFGNATKETVIRLYLNLMQAYPKFLDDDEGIGLYISVLKSYPCTVKK